MRYLRSKRRFLLVPLLAAALAVSGVASVALATCGPFGDVGPGICRFVLSMYYLGITAGTSGTTYSPNDPVTRGQMAIFLGTLYNQVKRTENGYRLATGMHSQAFNYNFADHFETVHTSFPVGFATDGQFNYVASANSNKIDMFNRNYGHGYVNFVTTVHNNGPMASDGNYLFIGTYNSNSLSYYRFRDSALGDPWVTGLNGLPNDIVIARDKLLVSHSTGVDLVGVNSGLVEHSLPMLTGGHGAVYVGANTFWAASGTQLLKVDLDSWAVSGAVNFNGTANGIQLAYDGQNVWVPLEDGTIDIVAIRGAQGGQVVDHLDFTGAGATGTGGIVFTGQWVVAALSGDFGCGTPTTKFYALDPATHAAMESVWQCGSGSFLRIGFDGQHVWPLGSDGNIIYVE